MVALFRRAPPMGAAITRLDPANTHCHAGDHALGPKNYGFTVVLRESSAFAMSHRCDTERLIVAKRTNS